MAKNYIVRNDTTITNHLTIKGEIINKGGAYNLWDDERGGKWQDLRDPTYPPTDAPLDSTPVPYGPIRSYPGTALTHGNITGWDSSTPGFVADPSNSSLWINYNVDETPNFGAGTRVWGKQEITKKLDASGTSYPNLADTSQNCLTIRSYNDISCAADLTFEAYSADGYARYSGIGTTRHGKGAICLEPSGNSYAMNFYVKTGSGAITDADKVFGIENESKFNLYTDQYVHLPYGITPSGGEPNPFSHLGGENSIVLYGLSGGTVKEHIAVNYSYIKALDVSAGNLTGYLQKAGGTMTGELQFSGAAPNAHINMNGHDISNVGNLDVSNISINNSFYFIGPSNNSVDYPFTVGVSKTWGASILLDASGTPGVDGGEKWLMQSTAGVADEGPGKFIITRIEGVDNSTKFTIDASGNVGIGTYDPYSQLHIKTANDLSFNEHTSGTNDISNIYGLLIDNQTTTDISGTTALGFSVKNNVSSRRASSAIVLEPSGNSYAMNFYVATGDVDISGTPQFGIQNESQINAYANIDMHSKSITNVATPADTSHNYVATVKYVADHHGSEVSGNYLNLSGGTMTGGLIIDDDAGLKIQEGATVYSQLSGNSTNGGYLNIYDESGVLKTQIYPNNMYIKGAGSANDGELNIYGNTVKLTGVLPSVGTFIGNLTGHVTGDVTGSSGSCTGNAVTATTASGATGALETLLTGKLEKAGGTMTGNISMDNSHYITNVATPLDTSLNYVATVGYVHTHGSGNYLNLSGGTMAGDIDMGTHKITNVATPTSNNDAATKVYVDTDVSHVIIECGTDITISNINTNLEYYVILNPAGLPGGTGLYESKIWVPIPTTNLLGKKMSFRGFVKGGGTDVASLTFQVSTNPSTMMSFKGISYGNSGSYGINEDISYSMITIKNVDVVSNIKQNNFKIVFTCMYDMSANIYWFYEIDSVVSDGDTLGAGGGYRFTPYSYVFGHTSGVPSVDNNYLCDELIKTT